MSEALRKKLKMIADFGYPWYTAVRCWHIIFTEKDIKYIKNVIMANKLYRPVVQNTNAYEKYTSKEEAVKEYDTFEKFNKFVLRGYIAEIKFFEPFMDDEDCPDNVKYFLFCHLGKLRMTLDAYRMYAKEYYHISNEEEEKKFGISKSDQTLQEFFTESWFRTVCVYKKKKTPYKHKKKKGKQKVRVIPPNQLDVKKNQDSISPIYMVLLKHSQLVKRK